MIFWTHTFLIGCTDSPTQFQVIDIDSGVEDYAILEREIPSLSNPQRMEGTLGNLYVGGTIGIDLASSELSYQQGRALQVDFQTKDDTAYPLDRDGLIAFSYYAHLEDTVALLETSEHNIDDILPMHSAVSPLIADLTLSFLPMENAAYVPTVHHFILLTDAIPKDVPLAVNKGVVGHEFGHALFHYLTTGGTTTPRLLDVDAEGQDSVYSLDEGLADVLGYLVSNRPNFIADSLPEQDRALDNEHLASDVSPLPGDEMEEGLLSLYDPYPLGSVFAATVWEVDSQHDDRTRMLNWLLDTTKEFGRQISSGERPDSVDLGMQWLDIWVDGATDTEKVWACQAIASRWDGVYEVVSCTE